VMFNIFSSISLFFLFSHSLLAGVIFEENVRIPMSDGVSISADIFKPDNENAYPVLYAVSPYIKSYSKLPVLPAFRFRQSGDIDWFVKHGFIVVHADTRGTGDSKEGVWKFLDQREQKDMYETIEWIARQKWSTGNIGMIGGSYYGVSQYFAALSKPPHLKCIAPYNAATDMYSDVFYHGGILNVGIFNWITFNTRANILRYNPKQITHDIGQDILKHDTYDEYWRVRSAYERLNEIDIPMFSIANWNSLGLHLKGNIDAFKRTSGVKKLLITAGDPQIQLYSNEIKEELLKWYNSCLKGEGFTKSDKKVKYFLRGAGKYKELKDWPTKSKNFLKYYLSEKKSNSVPSLNNGSLVLSGLSDNADSKTNFTYPDPYWGGWPGLGVTSFNPKLGLNKTSRILTYTSQRLTQDVEVTGEVVLHIYASTTEKDIDLYVKLVDHFTTPENSIVRRVVSKGWLKASQVDSVDKLKRLENLEINKRKLTPNKIYKLSVSLWPTAYLFKKGHRVSIELSNGDSPITDAPFYHYYGVKTGTDTFYHSKKYPSYIELPVLN